MMALKKMKITTKINGFTVFIGLEKNTMNTFIYDILTTVTFESARRDGAVERFMNNGRRRKRRESNFYCIYISNSMTTSLGLTSLGCHS